MAKFDTTKMKQNAPGLTYVTPQALPAKASALAGAAKMADTLIQGAVNFDKALTIQQADDIAKGLSSDYETLSATNRGNLLTDKENLEAELVNDPTNAKIQADLDVVTQKLEKAKEQGVISPYEFERRILKESQDLSNSNPAYADEISARVAKTLGNTGTLDLLKRDAVLVKAQQDAAIKEFEAVKKYLREDKKINTLGMSDSVIIAHYTKEMAEDKLREDIGQTLEDVELDDNVKRARLREHINSLGGPAKASHNMVKQIMIDLENISGRLSRGEITVEEATLARDSILIEADEQITNIATIMGDDEGFKAAYENTKNRIDKLTNTSFERMMGKNSKEFYENELSIEDTKQLLDFTERTGLSPKLLEIQNKLLTSMDNMIKNLNISLSEQQKNIMVNEIMMITKNPDATGLNLKSFKERPEVVISNSLLFNEVLESQIDQGVDVNTQPEAFAIMNNMFSTSKTQTNANKKYTVSKKLLATINGDAYKRTLPYMLGVNSSGSQWVEDLPNELAYFESATLDNMTILKHKKEDYYVSDGRIFSRLGVQQGRDMADSMNIAMELQGKRNNKDKFSDEDANSYLNYMFDVER